MTTGGPERRLEDNTHRNTSDTSFPGCNSKTKKQSETTYSELTKHSSKAKIEHAKYNKKLALPKERK